MNATTINANNIRNLSPEGSPSAAAGAPTPSRTQAGIIALEDLLKSRIKDCSPVGTSTLSKLNEEKSAHYALIYDNQQSFANYLQAEYGGTTFNNPDDFDTHVDDFLTQKALYESQNNDAIKNYSKFSTIMKQIEVIDEGNYHTVEKNIHPAGRMKTPFCTDVLSVEKQGIHNSGSDCWINAPLISLRDIYHSLDKEGKKALLAKINENTTSTSSASSSTKTNSPLAAFLEGKYDATTPAAAQLLRLDVLRILNHYNDLNTGNVLTEKPLEKCINNINEQGNSKDQADYLDMFPYLSKSLHIEGKVEHHTLFCNDDHSNSLRLENILAEHNPKDCYAFELNRSDNSGGSSSSTTGINKISINGLTDNLKLHGNKYMPASIICHLTDGEDKGHFINIFSRKKLDGTDQWYATSNHKTEAINLESEMMKDDKKVKLDISFSEKDPSSGSASTSEGPTTWKDFIALRAVNVTYVKENTTGAAE